MQGRNAGSSCNFLHCSKMAIASTMATVSSLSASSTSVKARRPVCFRSCPNLFTPKISPNPSLNLIRLKVCRKTSKASAFRGSIVSRLVDENSDAPSDSSTEATIDLKLPRRSSLVHFTCNVCGERSQKLINRLAYERGTIFVQCSGCLRHHKLVDNLGLVVEYDFREEANEDPNADQV